MDLGGGPSRRWLRQAATIAVTLRAQFLPASILPVALGALLARNMTGCFEWGLFGWTVLGVALLHLSANVANDYFDYRSGNDAANGDFIAAFTGGSRTVFDGRLSPQGLLALAMVCLSASLIPALYLAVRVGPWVLLLGAVGALSGWLYSAPPVRLASRGWGEATVALDFGPLPVLGSYWLQAREPGWTPVLVSLPLAALIAAVLVVNQLPDYAADRMVGKRNWVVRLGRRRGAWLYGMLATVWIPMILMAVWLWDVPKTGLWSLVWASIAVPAVVMAIRYHAVPSRLAPACGLTGLLHLGVGASMCIALAA